VVAFLVPTPERRCPIREVIYKQTEQGDLRLLIYEPETSQGDRPGVVFYYGGGWRGGNLDQFQAHSKLLARHGMVAVCAEYRVEKAHGITKPVVCVEDGRSVYRWVKAHTDELRINLDQPAAGGWSTGGHVALCVPLANDVNAADDDQAITCDPKLLLLFNPVGDAVARADRFRSEDDAPKVSPIHLMKDQIPPSIIFYGSDDWMIEEGKAVMEKSMATGVASDIFVADGEKNAFFNRSPWKETTIDLMHGYLVRQGYVEGDSGIEVKAHMHELAEA